MNKFKTMLIFTALFCSALPLMAQRQRTSPHETISTTLGDWRTGCRVTIVYGRPYTKDPNSGESRKIWGSLVPYDKAWRLGADEATLLITEQPLTFGEMTVPAGAYTLYMVPAENGPSKLAFSSRIGKWGIPVDESHDIARVDLKQQNLAKPVEQLTLTVESTPAATGVLKIAWETTAYTLEFSVNK
jgi:hypothetical protein